MSKDLIPWGWAPKGYLQNAWMKYRLNGEKLKKLLDLQNGKCAGCLEEFAHPFVRDVNKFGLKPEIDHDHAGGAIYTDDVIVRGLLCRKCNDFLGKINDNQELLVKLQAYLKNPPFARVA
tara:strand:+ start:409 stop:768 length:360 start_codon:yes stop_codon:yes gene_type:complete